MRNMVIIGSGPAGLTADRKSTRLNSSHDQISYAVFCLKKKKREISANRDSHSPDHRSGKREEQYVGLAGSTERGSRTPRLAPPIIVLPHAGVASDQR